MTRVAILLSLLLLGADIQGIAAQDGPCTYDQCALRLKPAAFGPRLVRGLNETSVAHFVFLAPRLDSLMQRSDSAMRYYSLFRARNNRGFWLSLAGLGLFGAGYLIYAVDRDLEGPAVAVSIAGAATWIVGVITQGRSRDPFSKAIWWYNRSLSHSSP